MSSPLGSGPAVTERPAATIGSLLDRATATGGIRLATLSALDLCVLGAPTQALFDELPARVWAGLDGAVRDVLAAEAAHRLTQRGLLLADLPRAADHGTVDRYTFHPLLGTLMAARSRPTFVVMCEVDHSAHGDGPRMYALGDQTDPVRGIVVELPVSVPPQTHGTPAELGPLGRLYRYSLVTAPVAAALLATWSMPEEAGPQAPPVGTARPRTVALFRQSEEHNVLGMKLFVLGDGTHARLIRSGTPDDPQSDVYDRTQLRAIMYNLLNSQPGLAEQLAQPADSGS